MADQKNEAELDQPLADIPLRQVLSFVTHDIYGPAAMLRTYLQAVADSTDDEELRSMIADAERLSGQVEGMLRFLRTGLSLDTNSLDIEVTPIRLLPFLTQWLRANPSVQGADRVHVDGDVRILADERHLVLALEGAAWQLGRMGSRQASVAMGVLDLSNGCARVGLWRPDRELDSDTLQRAVSARDEDWTTFLRRLPACGFPLRIALRLVQATGGKAEVRREEEMLVLAFPLRMPVL